MSPQSGLYGSVMDISFQKVAVWYCCKVDNRPLGIIQCELGVNAYEDGGEV